MRLQRIVRPDGSQSWTALRDDGSIDDDIDAFLTHLYATSASPNTIRAYGGAVVAFAKWLAADNLTFKDVTLRVYDRYRVFLQTGACQNPSLLLFCRDEPQTQKVSDSTLNNVHSAIKALFRFLDRDFSTILHASETKAVRPWDAPYRDFLWHITRSKGIRRDRYLRSKKRQNKPRLTPSQVLSLITACKSMRDILLIIVLYNSGLRIGEALGLRHEDVDSGERLISVVKREDNPNGARAKSPRNRKIPVNQYVINMYEDYLVSDEYEDSFESGTDFIFTNTRAGRIGRPMTYKSAESVRKILIRRTGIFFTWHYFRHTHISECIANGYNLFEASQRAGHSDVQVTNDFYKHLFDSEYKKIYLNSDEKVRQKLDELRLKEKIK